MFIVSQKVTLGFSQHLQSYEVVTPANPSNKIVYTGDFSCFLPLHQVKPVAIRTHSTANSFVADMISRLRVANFYSDL